MIEKEIKDEYNISEVLLRHSIEDDVLLKDIDDHLDKKLTVYLMDHERCRQATHNEWICCLHMALRDAENGKCALIERIEYIIDSCQSKKEE